MKKYIYIRNFEILIYIRRIRALVIISIIPVRYNILTERLFLHVFLLHIFKSSEKKIRENNVERESHAIDAMVTI